MGTRHRILQTADRLFRRYGYAAVGVDMIAEESGVAKMTLYRKFTSKDDLIVGVLEHEDEAIRTWLEGRTAGAQTARHQVRRFFEAIEARTGDVECSGCLFQMAFAEFPDPDHPVHTTARKHKDALRAGIERWVREAGLEDVVGTVNQLYALMEGAWASARIPHEPSRLRGIARASMLIVEGELFAQALDAESSTNRDR